jgi:hypothetical protein
MLMGQAFRRSVRVRVPVTQTICLLILLGNRIQQTFACEFDHQKYGDRCRLCDAVKIVCQFYYIYTINVFCLLR